MGKAIDTNLRTTNMGLGVYDDEVMKSLIKSNPLLILDNIVGKSYYPIFDGYKFKEKVTPLILEQSWELGGGGISPDSFSFLLDYKSNLYLPTMVINGIIGGVAFELAKEVFLLFKKKLSRKRQEVVFYSEKEEITYYEFPSETSISEFEQGLKDVPENTSKSKPQSHFIRSLKNQKWVLEDPS